MVFMNGCHCFILHVPYSIEIYSVADIPGVVSRKAADGGNIWESRRVQTQNGRLDFVREEAWSFSTGKWN